MEPSLELVSRYDVPAPRYTSYPTAAQFHTGIGPREYASAIRATNADLVPASVALYLHLPFCRSLCYYCACTKIVTRHPENVRHYQAVIASEAALVSPLLAGDRRVTSLHLGGGTPTYLSPGDIAGLIHDLASHFSFDFSSKREWSIEIDPRTVTPEDIGKLRAIGFDRLSLGIQDFDPNVQAAINRLQPGELVGGLVSAAREAGFSGLNFDLIYGLPWQTEESFERTLEQVVALDPDRIALYGYAHLPERFPAQRLIPRTSLPTGAAKLRLFIAAIRRLEGAGYVHIGMDHFAHAHDELAKGRARGTLIRNFQGYGPGPSTDLIGLGMSAISSLSGLYAQNSKSVRVWEKSVNAGRLPTERGYALSLDDRLRRDVIEAIMCRDEVVYEEFERRYDIGFEAYFGRTLARLDQMEKEGLLKRERDRLRITPMGRLFLRPIAKTFDAYIGPGSAVTSRFPYSQAV